VTPGDSDARLTGGGATNLISYSGELLIESGTIQDR
jgi:hypothetical protein